MTILSKNKYLQLQGNPNGDTSLRLGGKAVNSNAAYSLIGVTVLDDSLWHDADSLHDFFLQKDGGSSPYKLLYKGETKDKKDYSGIVLNFTVSVNQSVAGCLMIKIDGYLKYNSGDFRKAQFPFNFTGLYSTGLPPTTRSLSAGATTKQNPVTSQPPVNRQLPVTSKPPVESQPPVTATKTTHFVTGVTDITDVGGDPEVPPTKRQPSDTPTDVLPTEPIVGNGNGDEPGNVIINGEEPGNGNGKNPGLDNGKKEGNDSSLADSSTNESSGSSILPVAAGGAGAALVLAVLISLVVVLGRRCRAQKRRNMYLGNGGTLDQVISNPAYDDIETSSSSTKHGAGAELDNPLYDEPPSGLASYRHTSEQNSDHHVYDAAAQSIQSAPLPAPPAAVGSDLDNPYYNCGIADSPQTSSVRNDYEYRDPSNWCAAAPVQSEDYEAPAHTNDDYEDPDRVVEEARRISSNPEPNDDYEFVAEK